MNFTLERKRRKPGYGYWNNSSNIKTARVLWARLWPLLGMAGFTGAAQCRTKLETDILRSCSCGSVKHRFSSSIICGPEMILDPNKTYAFLWDKEAHRAAPGGLRGRQGTVFSIHGVDSRDDQVRRYKGNWSAN